MTNFVFVNVSQLRNHLHHWSCPATSTKKAQNFALTHPTVAAFNCVGQWAPEHS